MPRLYSNKTFKLLLCVFVSLWSISGWAENDHRGIKSQSNQRDGLYGAAVTLAIIKDNSITESSGLVASRSAPGAYWTHNDSGDGPFVYAFNNSGVSLGVFRVTGAQARDWEDIDAGPGPQRGKSYLYIGDIGDNGRERPHVTVYRVLEPVLPSNTTKRRPRATEPAVAIRLQYPDGSHDAETLLVHPTSGAIYIVTKVAVAKPVVYEAVAPFDTTKVITLRRIGELAVPNVLGLITGGSISPDGRRVVLCDYFQGYELALPAGSASFNDIWKQKMTGFDLGKRKQGEAITYRLDGKAILATSEGKQSPLIQVERRQ